MAKSAETEFILTQEHFQSVPPNIKTVVESSHLVKIPSSYTFTENSLDQVISDKEDPVPVIDYTLLVSSDPNQRSQIIQELARACQNWGFFKVINHGVPERLMKEMIEAFGEFFELPGEEKKQYEGKHILDPIISGTSINTAKVQKVYCWRDFLKTFVHPVFHSPTKPLRFRETVLEYSKKTREIAREILGGISESLGLEANYIETELNLGKGVQMIAGNFYPPCPQPELAMGIPPHTDYGLLTFLIHNGINGLQVQHNGKWIDVNAIPNSFFVNTCDHLEILSNGKYRSLVHRAVVNNKATRISVATVLGPSMESVVSPAAELLDRENKEAAYIGMEYKEYLLLKHGGQLDRKT